MLDFGEIVNKDHRYFSLFIGMNGVGKSTFMREIVDFFIDSKYGKSRKIDGQQVRIISLRYAIKNSIIQIDKDENNVFTYKRDGKRILVPDYPLIIATTMGMFDKFPLNSPNPLRRKGRYDVPFYKYVGPKANNNMFASKTNLMLQMLSIIGLIKRKSQLSKIGDILKFIGYKPIISLSFSIKDNAFEIYQNKQKYFDEETYFYLKSIVNSSSQIHKYKIEPQSDTITYVQNLHLRELNLLRQEGVLQSLKCTLYREGDEIDCNQVSSGEFNLLSILMSVVLSAGNQYLLVLLDEPEISQHPNWQLSIVDKLDEALSEYACHFLIASHCHFLVSNLPQNRSNVFDIEFNQLGNIEIKPLKSETYGWSAEQVLLEVFKVGTDRNRYLASVVGKLLEDIGNNKISPENLGNRLRFLLKVQENLSDVDPLKKIITLICKEFAYE
jgi:predicted ATPase